MTPKDAHPLNGHFPRKTPCRPPIGDGITSLGCSYQRRRKDTEASPPQMREQLVAAVAGVLQHAATAVDDPTPAEEDRILNVADIVTLARTAVERDW
jgi:hypothetical protein